MIRAATPQDIDTLTHLAALLWPKEQPRVLADEFAAMLTDNDAQLFLAFDNTNAIGFAQCQLRHDYVEGTETTPVGYLEGIFVKEGHRHQGHARALLAACEAWAKAKGCKEFASDCELDNTDSFQFHKALHFNEAGRIICFTKRL